MASDWDGFRRAARTLLRDGVDPDTIRWDGPSAAEPQLSLLRAAPAEAPEAGMETTPSPRVPPRLLELGEAVACHRSPRAWPWLYRVLWRVVGGERELLDDAADADVARLHAMERSVRRDVHKMTAFVRFRSVGGGEAERFVAWFEPRHLIVRRAAPFFQRRFPSMRWSILTPDECAHWDGEALAFSPGVARPGGGHDPVEADWLAYYASTFNPARVRPRAMRAEMPLFYWRNLPEARVIPELLREAPARVRDMVERAGSALPPSAAVPAPPVVRRAVAEPIGEPPPELAPVRVPGIRVGVAGWDYPDWAGRVYPPGRGGVDRLRWVAARFDLLEVNSTFYRPVTSRVARTWLRRTEDRPRLRFAAKLVRGFTHERGPWREADAAAVREGLLPLHEEGRLVSLLAQFPASFRNRPDERRWLKRVVDAFAEFPLHVEVRHRSWDDPAFRSWLRDRGVGLVNVDQPLFDDSLEPAAEATSRVAYLRLHGRNAAAWFRADATRDERYDYLYGAAELEPWVRRARELAARPDVDEVEVVFNNHYRGQAVTNAEEFALALAAAG